MLGYFENVYVAIRPIVENGSRWTIEAKEVSYHLDPHDAEVVTLRIVKRHMCVKVEDPQEVWVPQKLEDLHEELEGDEAKLDQQEEEVQILRDRSAELTQLTCKLRREIQFIKERNDAAGVPRHRPASKKRPIGSENDTCRTKCVPRAPCGADKPSDNDSCRTAFSPNSANAAVADTLTVVAAFQAAKEPQSPLCSLQRDGNAWPEEPVVVVDSASDHDVPLHMSPGSTSILDTRHNIPPHATSIPGALQNMPPHATSIQDASQFFSRGARDISFHSAPLKMDTSPKASCISAPNASVNTKNPEQAKGIPAHGVPCMASIPTHTENKAEWSMQGARIHAHEVSSKADIPTQANSKADTRGEVDNLTLHDVPNAADIPTGTDKKAEIPLRDNKTDVLPHSNNTADVSMHTDNV